MRNILADTSIISQTSKSGIGIKINKDNPNIPFLMFADKCILFSMATKKMAQTIK